METRNILAAIVATALAGASLHAASQSWSAKVNANWDTTTANWSGAVWTNGNDAVFGTTGTGTVNVGQGVSANSLTFNAAGFTVTGGPLTLTGPAAVTANANATLAAAITGSSGLTTAGPGTLTLASASTFTGNTHITGGVLDLTHGMLYGGADTAATISVGAGATLRLAGENAFSWAGNPGIGKLYLNDGGVLVNGGTIDFTGTTATGGGRDFSIGALGATLQSSQTGGVLTIAGGYTGIVSNNSSLTLAGTGGAVMKSKITGTGALVKKGSGIWTLSGANDYTGATTVHAGTLAISGSTRTVSLAVAPGATMAVAGAGTAGLLEIPGKLALAGGSCLNVDLGGVGASDMIHLSGTYAPQSGVVTIDVNALAGFGTGTYHLITGAAGIRAGSFAIHSAPAGYACTLSAGNGTLSLTVAATATARRTVLGTVATIGSAFSYQIALVSNATGYAAAGLPPGLSLNPGSGLITGTPTEAGTYYASISATRADGTANSQLIIVVTPLPGAPVPPSHPPRVLSETATTQTVQPARDNTLLINPGKGFVEYWGPCAYTNDVSGVEYDRCSWNQVEPQEGVYNWAWIDGKIAQHAAYGKKFAFGIMNTDPGFTPDWVFKPGTNATTGAVYPVGAASKKISDGYVVPVVWDEPVYLARMKSFIKAMGARYNGHPNIAYIDVRNYGRDGEGNGSFNPETKDVTPESLRDNFYKPYMDAFPDTHLLALGGDWLYHGIFEYVATRGVGRRIDGICNGQGNASECMVAYPYQPAVLEYWNPWPVTLAAGFGDPNTLMGFVTGARASYLQMYWQFYEANKEFCHLLGNLLGYHFVIQQAVIPKTITANTAFPLSIQWYNDGVAPLYEPCCVAVALLDSSNNVVHRQWLAGSNPKGWLPGVPTTENFNVTFPSVPPGYRLAVGLFGKQSDATPTYKLGIHGRTVTGWYVLTGKADQPPAIWTNASGGSWQSSNNWTGSDCHNGIDVVADFSTLNLTADATVTLDGKVTVGKIVFGGTTPGSGWSLAGGKDGVLNLRVSPGAPAPCISVNSANATLNADLTGNQGFVKDGPGTLVLAGKNSQTGNTVVNGGVLEIAPTSSLYAVWQMATVTVNAGATLRVTNWSSYGPNGLGDLDEVPMEEPKVLALNGGTLEFSGTRAASGQRAFSIGAGGATLRNSSTQPWVLNTKEGCTSLTNNTSLTLAGTGPDGQVQKAILGTGTLTKADSGTWTLSGNNAYSGITKVLGGKLVIGGTIDHTSGVGIAAKAEVEVTGKLVATGNIINNGTLVLSGAAQFGAGGTITNNGTLINNSPTLKLPPIINHGKITADGKH
jgi:autotransporter-associated beta strand protein